MSNADVSRAANSAVDAASAGLDKYFQTLQERVVSLLAADRASFTQTLEDVQTMLGAVAHEQHETRAEGKRDRSELLSGIHGLAQDLSVLASQIEKHDRDIEAIIKRLDHKRERIEVLETQVREMRGPEMLPEQRQRYITILMRMIAEWERTHPDE